jgi:hypothetical protein
MMVTHGQRTAATLMAGKGDIQSGVQSSPVVYQSRALSDGTTTVIEIQCSKRRAFTHYSILPPQWPCWHVDYNWR